MLASKHSVGGDSSAIGALDVQLQIDNKILLKDVTLTLSSTGLSVVMGYNGAGKSLLLKLLHGLIPATSGTVFAPTLVTDSRAVQAMVFQSPTLLRRTVSANLRFTMKLRGTFSPVWHDELLERVGLSNSANQPARSLSGGEQQRLAVARALSLKPDILFLDEPTASLDPYSAQIIEQLLIETSDCRTKVILVTHDISQAKRLADEVIFVHHGTIGEHQSADAFFTSPSTPAASAYLEGQLYV